MDEKLEVFKKLGVYIEMEYFKGITMEALVEDIRAFLPKFNRFSKKAVVGPETTLTNIGEKIAKLIPNIEFKHFLPADKENAKAWVEDV